MNIIKKFMQIGEKQEVVMIPSGEFNLLRSSKSPKSSLECIYNDAMLRIRKNGEYNFELVVSKIVDLNENVDDNSSDYTDDSSVLSVTSNRREEEWTFVLDESLQFSKEWNKRGDAAFVWCNTLGDVEVEKVQFVITPLLTLNEIEDFLLTVYRCMYEHKNRKSAADVPRDELYKYQPSDNKELFVNESDSPIPDDLGVSLTEVGPEKEIVTIDSDHDEFVDAQEVTPVLRSKSKSKKKSNSSVDKKVKSSHDKDQKRLHKAPDGEVLCLKKAELSVYDPFQEKFLLQEKVATVALIEKKTYEYWLAIEGQEIKFGVDVSPSTNPSFAGSNSSFTFNYTVSRITLSYRLIFKDVKDFTDFESVWSKCVWMTLNKKDWGDIPETEQRYIEETITADLERDLDNILRLDEEESGSESDDDEYSKRVISSEAFEEPGSGGSRGSSKGNSSLTVAFRGNRSYVVRDNNIGVFKVDDDDDLEFVAAIKDVVRSNKKEIDPQDPMMYMEDHAMVFSDSKNKNTLYKMDIEKGKVVDEWQVGDKTVVQYGPTKKFDQLTSEQTMLCLSNNGVFKIDPRVHGSNKIVQDESKEYATKYNFSSISTTQHGYIAIGSKRGEIRLYDRLGIRAKTLIPSLGQPIKHLCTSADGKWLLATCDASLLLMDLQIKSGKNTGEIGFLKSMPSGDNVKTYILKISPEHATHILNQTKKPLCFSRAFFNTGIGQKEDTIVTSNGPFAISWSLPKVIRGDKKPYTLDWYESPIIENNFEFGNKDNVIVALKDDVSLSKIKNFKKPTKSIFLRKSES
ncbi:Vacuolar import and degradation protein 27 [Nakaseomyces bracarensis]|uniref:Vacuolar import and degradation protein 27 n=1 Tax=Nakaseomyces bracarensis TaxID=273131 RepID=A0ABR4NNF5_9SACH